MRAAPIPAAKQYQLIMECRSSGQTDYQWCVEHGIKPGTFYNWVKRLRQRGCQDFPAAAAARVRKGNCQEIVQIQLGQPEESFCQMSVPSPMPLSVPAPSEPGVAVLEVLLCGHTIRIPNGTDPFLLETVLRLLKEQSC